MHETLQCHHYFTKSTSTPSKYSIWYSVATVATFKRRLIFDSVRNAGRWCKLQVRPNPQPPCITLSQPPIYGTHHLVALSLQALLSSSVFSLYGDKVQNNRPCNRTPSPPCSVVVRIASPTTHTVLLTSFTPAVISDHWLCFFRFQNRCESLMSMGYQCRLCTNSQ